MNIPINLCLSGELGIDVRKEIRRDTRRYDCVDKLIEAECRENLMSVQGKCP